MPNRNIRESIVTSETLEKCSAEAERLFFRLTVVADDTGRFNADSRVVLARCFPLFAGKWKPEKVGRWIDELAKHKAIVLYTNGTPNRYGYFPSWAKYQRVYGHPSKFPNPTGCSRVPPDTPGDPRSYSQSSTEKEKEIKNDNGAGHHTAREKLEAFTISPELKAWSVSFGIAHPEDYLEEFKDYWRSVDGKRRGGCPVKDWDATFRNRLRELKASGKLHARGPGVVGL